MTERRGLVLACAALLGVTGALFASIGRAQDGDAALSRRNAVLSCIASHVQTGMPPAAAAALCMSEVEALERLAAGRATFGVDIRAVQAAARGVGRGDALVNAGAAVTAACTGGDPRRSAGDDDLNDLETERGGGRGFDEPVPPANFQDASGDKFYCDSSGCTRVYDQLEDDELEVERRTASDNACQQVVTQAALLLSECNRTQWKGQACQSLRARMRGCPDPSKIYVDPDAGYVCGAEAVSPERVREVFTLACEKRTRPGPDGSPCAPPEVKGSGRGWPATSGDDICRNPLAYTTGDMCIAEVSNPTNIEPGGDWRTILAIYLPKLGGPGAILPGGGPMPRPRTNCPVGARC